MRKNGQFSEALAVLKEANSIHEIPYTNLLIGKILFTQKKLEALGYFEKAHKEIKDDPSLIYGLCLLYIMKGDFSNAKISLDDFARLEGKNHPQYRQLTALFEKQVNKSK